MDSCSEEKDKIWALLERWPSIEPSADFRARFWEKVNSLERMPVYWRLAPVFASILFVIVLAGAIFMKTRIENMNLAKDIELYRDFEIIQEMDLLVDLDFLAEQNECEG
jgi:hypothetical protein